MGIRPNRDRLPRVQSLESRIARGLPTVVLGSSHVVLPPKVEGPILRVSCDVPRETFGPLLQLTQRIGLLLGETQPLLETARNQVFELGRRVLGDGPARSEGPTETFVQSHPTLSNQLVRRPIICGAGALIEGDFAGMAAADVVPADSIVSVVNNVAMVTREAIDRLQQIIAQSWYWIGGFCAPSDTTTTPTTIPTATNAAFKRAVVVEHIG